MSGIVNKVKEVLHSDKSSAPEGTHGPHSSRTANAADPRVDSDRDGSRTVGGTTTQRTAGHGEFGSGTGGLGSTGAGAGYGEAREGEHGPHGSRLANAADPRVDSDRDGSRTVGNQGGYSSGATAGGLGSSGTGAGYGSTGAGAGYGSAGYGETREGERGPHNSRLANAADPRVDSDRDGSRTVGNNQGGYSSGATAGGLGSTGAGAGYGAAGSGPGPAPNTAGPHKSDALNKADPRVDSDLDGSKTLGGDRTYQ